jgi:large subunit ribosomal protein L25
MEPVKLEANNRPQSGKGNARRLRNAGQIPAIAYGKTLPSTPLAVSPKALTEILFGDYGKNTVIDLAIEGGKTVRALLGDYQYHPVTRQLLHADFIEIRDDQLVDVEVPFETTGRAKGVVLGGTLRQVFRSLPIRCLPQNIPVKLTHDVTEIGVDEHVSVSQLSLPEGVEVRLRPAQTVAAVVGEKHRGGEGEEAAEGGDKPAEAKASK